MVTVVSSRLDEEQTKKVDAQVAKLNAKKKPDDRALTRSDVIRKLVDRLPPT